MREPVDPAKDSPVTQALKLLLAAYPDKNLTTESLRLYLAQLEDIPPWLLRCAVVEHIQSCVYFPRIAELRQAAERIAGAPLSEMQSAACPAVYEHDPLTVRCLRLEEAFYHDGELDIAKWEALISELYAAGREHRAEAVRNRLDWMRGSERP